MYFMLLVLSYRGRIQMQNIKKRNEVTLIKQSSKTINERNYENLITQGRRYYLKNELQSAIEHLSRSLFYTKDNEEVNLMLGVAYLYRKQYNVAFEYLQQLPPKPDNILLLAITYNKLGKLQDALIALDKHIQIIVIDFPLEAYFLKAKIFSQLQDFQNATKNLDSILKVRAKHKQTLLFKLQCLEKQRLWSHYKDLLQYFQKQNIFSKKKLFDLQMKHISLLRRERLFQEALSIIKRIKKKQDPIVIFIKGKVLQELKRNSQALQQFIYILSTMSPQHKAYEQALCEVAITRMRDRDFYDAFTYLKQTSSKQSKILSLTYLAEGVTLLMKKKYAQGIALLRCVKLQAFSEQQDKTFLKDLQMSALGFGYFSMGGHQAALAAYESVSQLKVGCKYNMLMCKGVLAAIQDDKIRALQCFEEAREWLNMPQSYFYSAVVAYDGGQGETILVLNILEEGLKVGECAQMHYFRSLLHLQMKLSTTALEQIDAAIEKSEDNIAKYFLQRGLIFMADKNYQQALSQFNVAISVCQKMPLAQRERAKCLLLAGQSSLAYSQLGEEDSLLWQFALYEHRFQWLIQEECPNKEVLQTAYFMQGQWMQAGAAGKLVLGLLYHAYGDVCRLVSQALDLQVNVGCMEAADLLFIKGYCLVAVGHHSQAAETYAMLEGLLRSDQSDLAEEEERRLLLCKLNSVMLLWKIDQHQAAVEAIRALLQELCEGHVFELLSQIQSRMKENIMFQRREEELVREQVGEVLRQKKTNQEFVIKVVDEDLISDLFEYESKRGIKFTMSIPFPRCKVSGVEHADCQSLLKEVKIEQIESKPQPPWILRGKYGIIFTNEIKEFNELKLQTEEAEEVMRRKEKQVQNLRLDSALLSKLEKISKKQP